MLARVLFYLLLFVDGTLDLGKAVSASSVSEGKHTVKNFTDSDPTGPLNLGIDILDY